MTTFLSEIHKNHLLFCEILLVLQAEISNAMKNYLILNDLSEGFVKKNSEELGKMSFSPKSLRICIEYPTDTDGIFKSCNIGYYDSINKLLKPTKVTIGHVTIESLTLKCSEKFDDDYSCDPFSYLNSERSIAYEFLIHLNTECPEFYKKVNSYSEYLRHRDSFIWSSYRYGNTNSSELKKYANKIGSKQFSYIDCYEYKKEPLWDEYETPLLHRLIKNIRILNSALDAGFCPKELDIDRYHLDASLNDNEIMSEMLARLKVDNNFLIFPVEYEKTYATQCLSIVFDGKVFTNYRENGIYCSIPDALKTESKTNILHRIKTELFSEYVSNFSLEKTDVLHLLTKEKFIESMSQETSSSKLFGGIWNDSNNPQKNVIEFLMSIECNDIVKAYRKVGGDDREVSSQSISFHITRYEPNAYCISVLSKILGCNFELKDNILKWEDEKTEYVGGVAEDCDNSLNFKMRNMKSIIDHFTYSLLNSGASDWVKSFYD